MNDTGTDAVVGDLADQHIAMIESFRGRLTLKEMADIAGALRDAYASGQEVERRAVLAECVCGHAGDSHRINFVEDYCLVCREAGVDTPHAYESREAALAYYPPRVRAALESSDRARARVVRLEEALRAIADDELGTGAAYALQVVREWARAALSEAGGAP